MFVAARPSAYVPQPGFFEIAQDGRPLGVVLTAKAAADHRQSENQAFAVLENGFNERSRRGMPLSTRRAEQECAGLTGIENADFEVFRTERVLRSRDCVTCIGAWSVLLEERMARRRKAPKRRRVR